MDGTTACEVLGVPPRASRKTIKKAFRRLAQTAHPDVSGSADEFRRIKQAFDVAYASAPSGDPLGPLLGEGRSVSSRRRRGKSSSGSVTGNGETVDAEADASTRRRRSFSDAQARTVVEAENVTAPASANYNEQPPPPTSRSVVHHTPTDSVRTEPGDAPTDDTWAAEADLFRSRLLETDLDESEFFETTVFGIGSLETDALAIQLLETRLFDIKPVDNNPVDNNQADGLTNIDRTSGDVDSPRRSQGVGHSHGLRPDAARPCVQNDQNLDQSRLQDNERCSSPRPDGSFGIDAEVFGAPWLTNVVEDYPATAVYDAIIAAAIPRDGVASGSHTTGGPRVRSGGLPQPAGVPRAAAASRISDRVSGKTGATRGRSTIEPATGSTARQRSSDFAEMLEQAMSEAG